MTILGRGDLSPRRRSHRRGPVLATVLVAGLVAAAGWFGWHALRGHDAGGKVAIRTCVTPTPAPVPAEPGHVTVRVFNATDKVGLAHQVAAALRTRGFRIGKVGNTKASVTGVGTISFGPSDRAAAIAVAEHVPGVALVPATAGGVTLSLGPAFTALATAPDATAARARDLASASPRPVACTTP